MRSTEKYQNNKNTFKRQLSLPKMGKIDLDTNHTDVKDKIDTFSDIIGPKGETSSALCENDNVVPTDTEISKPTLNDKSDLEMLQNEALMSGINSFRSEESCKISNEIEKDNAIGHAEKCFDVNEKMDFSSINDKSNHMLLPSKQITENKEQENLADLNNFSIKDKVTELGNYSLNLFEFGVIFTFMISLILFMMISLIGLTEFLLFMIISLQLIIILKLSDFEISLDIFKDILRKIRNRSFLYLKNKMKPFRPVQDKDITEKDTLPL